MSALAFAAPRRVSLLSAFASRRPSAETTLLFLYLYFTFIGTHPFSEGDASSRVDGSPLDRIYILGQTGLALFVLWRRRAAAWRAARSTWLVWAIVAICSASILWSDYPDLTLRRAMLLDFLTLAALGVAAGVADLRRFHSFLFVFLVVVIAVNILMVGASPGTAISGIGVRGIYTQKNVAGMVTMIAIVVGATWVAGAPNLRVGLRGLVALAPMAAFLVLTRSKTSMSLTGVAIAGIVLVGIVEHFGARLALLAVSGFLAAIASLIGLLAALDFDFNRAFEAAFGDTSFTGRDEIWAFAWREILKRPWLGHGYGAFWDVGPVNDPIAKLEPGTWLGDVAIGEINQAHNGYLELCLHVGIPLTVAATLAVLFVALYAGNRAIAAPAPRADRAAIGAMATLLLLYLVHNYTEATLFMRGSPFFNVGIIALFLTARADALLLRRRWAAPPPSPPRSGHDR